MGPVLRSSRDRGRRSRAARALLGALVALGTIAASRDATAFSVKKTQKGALVHWEEASVSFTFDPSCEANVPEAARAATIAMGSWSGNAGAPELRGVPASAVPDAPPRPALDHKNGVFYMAPGYGPVGKALAITVLTYDNASGAILDSDIIVNGAYRFAVLDPSAVVERTPAAGNARPSSTDAISHADEGSSDPGSVYDVHHVFAHEIGHSLGMNDELSRRDSLMYRYTAPNDTTMRAPVSDDIEGLAELYSTRLQASGNGCQSSTVAPKKPSAAASHLAMFGTLAFLFYLVLRGRGDRRARFAFVAAAAVATYAMLPAISAKRGEARADTTAAGSQARAKVLTTSVAMNDGLLQTSYQLAVTACRTTSCPQRARGIAWGGTAGNIRQDVGSELAPTDGDDVEVSFFSVPGALAPLSHPLGGGAASQTATVRVLTPAD